MDHRRDRRNRLGSRLTNEPGWYPFTSRGWQACRMRRAASVLRRCVGRSDRSALADRPTLRSIRPKRATRLGRRCHFAQSIRPRTRSRAEGDSVQMRARDQLRIRSHWLAGRLIRKKRRSRSGSAGSIPARAGHQLSRNSGLGARCQACCSFSGRVLITPCGYTLHPGDGRGVDRPHHRGLIAPCGYTLRPGHAVRQNRTRFDILTGGVMPSRPIRRTRRGPYHKD